MYFERNEICIRALLEKYKDVLFLKTVLLRYNYSLVKASD